METRTLAVLATAIAGALVLSQTVFMVHQNELAIRSELGKIIQSDYTAGMHFKLPFVNDVRRLDKRVLTRNYPAEQFLTSEGKILNVDFYVKWRITDVAQYYRATGGNEEAASARLAEIVKDGLKGVIAKRTIQQVEGVSDAKANGYERGILTLDVAHQAKVVIKRALLRLDGMRLRVVEEGPGTLTLQTEL